MNWIPNPKTVRLFVFTALLLGSSALAATPPGWYGELRPWQPLILTPNGLTAARPTTASDFYLLTNTFTLDWPVLPPHPAAPAPRLAFAQPRATTARPMVLEPGPGSDAYQIVFTTPAIRELLVCNSDGRPIGRTQTTNEAYFLRTTDWPAGTYFLTVREEARRSVYRLFVD